MSAPSLDDIRRWDAADALAAFRGRFELPKGVIYLDGNSLGALPVATKARLADVVETEWGRGLIRSWNSADWIEAPQRVGAKIARIIGAQPNEVIVADSTSVNLFKLLTAALGARPGRRVILTEPGNFPTDLYVAKGVATLLDGVEVRTAPRDQIAEAIAADVAVVMLTHVHYKTGERFDMAAITQAAHDKGALMLWDLSHSAGALAVDLNVCDADLAIGCGYKYLNGGPGAPAFVFVTQRLQAQLSSPLTGWMGHATPFAFGDDYAAGEGVKRFLCGTPPILALAALEVGVDLFLEADLHTIADKSQRLCSLFIDLVEERCDGLGLSLATPRHAARRGSHVSLRHDHGYEVMQALIAQGVIGDFRAPDILRFGFTPLYTSFADVWSAAGRLYAILADRTWDQAQFAIRAKVT